MKISRLNRRSRRFADGWKYPPHWSTQRILTYQAFIKKHAQPKPGKDYDKWYGMLVSWMNKAGFQ